ncbi:hypothetical protein ElyMa_003096400 [Elysia marginata]|uniref:Uncharacterized protein n=1 Tax=Elysia marginata TaxID=1093978 RepID=A0AAV4INL3_9GAST|nr:hypothetical protein ElyMa_003096400 [Elysia marginata]
MCIKRIQVFINRCLRRILRIKWTYKISNESLWERTRQIPAGDEIGRRRWRWIGHTLRKLCVSITKNVLDWNPQGKRSRGRPRGTWRRVRDNDVKDSGHTWNHVKRMAQDRERDGGALLMAFTLLQGAVLQALKSNHLYSSRRLTELLFLLFDVANFVILIDLHCPMFGTDYERSLEIERLNWEGL